MKSFFRLICLFLVICMILPINALAAEIPEPRASYFFAAHGAYVEKVSSTELEVWFDVTAVAGMLEVGAETIKVQKSSDRVNWTTVKTYTKDDYPEMTDTNTAGHASHVSYDEAESGYYYRAYINFYARNSSGTGEYPDYTSSIKM